MDEYQETWLDKSHEEIRLSNYEQVSRRDRSDRRPGSPGDLVLTEFQVNSVSTGRGASFGLPIFGGPERANRSPGEMIEDALKAPPAAATPKAKAIKGLQVGVHVP